MKRAAIFQSSNLARGCDSLHPLSQFHRQQRTSNFPTPWAEVQSLEYPYKRPHSSFDQANRPLESTNWNVNTRQEGELQTKACERNCCPAMILRQGIVCCLDRTCCAAADTLLVSGVVPVRQGTGDCVRQSNRHVCALGTGLLAVRVD